jgi:hypothetical protein
MNTQFEDDELENETSYNHIPKRKNSDNPSANSRDSWIKVVVIPIVVALISAVAVILSGNGQVLVNLVNTVINNSDEEGERTQSTDGIVQADATHTSTEVVNSRLATLTPGTLLLDENFNDGIADKISYDGDFWQIVDDGTGSNPVFQVNTYETTIDKNALQFGDPSWGDFNLEYQIRLTSFDPADTNLYDAGMTIVTFRNNYDQCYIFNLTPYYRQTGIQFGCGTREWEALSLYDPGYDVDPNIWYSIKIVAKESNLAAFVNETLVAGTNDQRLRNGFFTMGAAPDTIAQFDNIKITAL